MDVLSSRLLLRPSDPGRSRHFYAHTLGLAVYREFGPEDQPGVVFFLGQGFLEVSGRSDAPAAAERLSIWLQVRDLRREEERLRQEGVTVLREARLEPWGLIEMWIADPDGHHIVLVEVPPGHPLRRDPR
ncbi:VOC family protein [Nonomuraea sp. M3C6]|uniref:VOC family protein n=1 Tax=Nonomuraea marmarensis TaxID=3351344 RepID=A0ABW7AF27_9ACTN